MVRRMVAHFGQPGEGNCLLDPSVRFIYKQRDKLRIQTKKWCAAFVFIFELIEIAFGSVCYMQIHVSLRLSA